MAGESYELEFAFDRAFLWRALWRDHAWLCLYSILFAVGAVFVLGWALDMPDLPAYSPLPILLCALYFLLRLRGAVAKTYEMWTKQSPNGTMRYVVDADTITVELEHARSRFAWKDLRRLWRYPDVWAFEIVRKQSLLFPPREAPEDMKAFIVERCRDAGIRT